MTEQTQRMIAIGAVGVAVTAVALDNLVGLPIDESPHVARFFGFSFLCVGVAAAVFLMLVPWAEDESEPGGRLSWSAFGLGLASLLTLVVFLTGVPFVLAAGAFVLGRLGDERAGSAAEETEDGRRQDETQEPDPGEEDESDPSRRASLAWASTALGVLVFAAAAVLFAVLLVAG